MSAAEWIRLALSWTAAVIAVATLVWNRRANRRRRERLERWR